MPIYKALSIKQPHINNILIGKKKLEIRSWKTKYRGPLILCASKIQDKNFPKSIQYNLGCLICFVELIDIVEFKKEDEEYAYIPFVENNFAWKLNFIKELPKIPIKGKLSIFNLELPMKF